MVFSKGEGLERRKSGGLVTERLGDKHMASPPRMPQN
jgi:hypothetical protein